MTSSIAILGSARSDGNTAGALSRLVEGLPCEILDLSRQRIADFSYTQDYGEDDFVGIVERIVHAPVTILATPVYWYSWSTPMKRFIDRFTDLLMSRRPLGRQLRGRCFGLLSTGNAPEPDSTLNKAFSGFCDYLGIENLGMAYSCGDGPFLDDRSVLRIRERIGPR